MTTRRHALVLGGTGAIGTAVVQGLARAQIPTTFSYLRSDDRAKALAAEHSARPVRVDLARATEVRALFSDLDAARVAPDVLIHCAAVHRPAALDTVTEGDLDLACRISGGATLVATQEFARRLIAEGRPGHVVLVGALDRGQSLPLAVPFAAAQGMLGAMAMALAKELGGAGIRVNLVTGGIIGAGISAALEPSLIEDYKRFSALHRLGTAEEIAAAVLFVALENSYMSGKVLAANGGI